MAKRTENIAQWQIPNEPEGIAEVRFHPAIRDLPKRLSAIAFALLERTPDGESVSLMTYDELDVWVDQLDAALRKFAKLSLPDRLRILQIFFGDYAPVVEATWRRMQAGDRPIRPTYEPPTWVQQQHLGWYFLEGALHLACDFDSAALDTMRMLQNYDQYESDQRCYHELIAPLVVTEIEAGGEQADRLLAELDRQQKQAKARDYQQWQFLESVLLSVDQPAAWQRIFAQATKLKPSYNHRQMVLWLSIRGHHRAFVELVRFLLAHPPLLADAQFGGTLGRLGYEQGDVADGARRWLAFCDDPKQRQKALAGDDPHAAAIALKAQARFDLPATYEACDRLLEHTDPAVRCATTIFLYEYSADPDTIPLRIKALADDDLRVPYYALFGKIFDDRCPQQMAPYRPLVKALLKLVKRLPAVSEEVSNAVWPFSAETLSVEKVSLVLQESYETRYFDLLYAARKSLSPEVRESLEEEQ